MNTPSKVIKPSRIQGILTKIEVYGNKLPDPVTVFLYFCILIILLSGVCSFFEVTAIHPLTKKTISVINLCSFSNLQELLGEIVNNFQAFPPLGLVLVTMIGVGVADKSGLMEAAMKHAVLKTPPKLITAVIIFAGILANAAGDAGNIVLPPLAAIVFLSMGRHPLTGIFAAFAGVAGGFSANLVVNMSDVLAASFTIPAAQIILPEYNSTPAMNYYFMLVSTILVLIAGVFVTEKIIAPRLGDYEEKIDLEKSEDLSPPEKKALKYSLISLFVLALLLIAMCIGPNAFMKDPKTHSLMAFTSPFMQGLVPIIAILFLVPGYVYGKITGNIKNDKDTVAMMGKSMGEMGPYIVLAFMAAQFLSLFADSNLGMIISIKGANFLKNVGLSGPPLIIGFILMSSCLNLFIGSASAKWAILAPVFVPMFLLLGYDPALTQVAYRIGDSISNGLSPLYTYFPIILAFIKKYDNYKYWYDLDVPDAIELRTKFLKEDNRKKFIAKSMFDYSWMDDIDWYGEPVLIIAEGLFMYFAEDELKKLFNKLISQFPEAEMLFEMLPPFLVGKAKKHESLKTLDNAPEFKWGLKKSREIESWNCKIGFIEEWNYYNYHKKRWKWFGLMARLPLLRQLFACRIVHIGFKRRRQL